MILNARVYDVCIESPLQLAKNMSTRLGNKVYLKREDMQPIFSFKCRGAYNRMCQLVKSERDRGVVAVSAGMWRFPFFFGFKIANAREVAYIELMWRSHILL